MKTTKEPSQPKAKNIIRPASYKRGPSSVHSGSSTSSLRTPKLSTNIVEKSGFSVYTATKKTTSGFPSRPPSAVGYKPLPMVRSLTISQDNNRPRLVSRSVLGPIINTSNNTLVDPSMTKPIISKHSELPGKLCEEDSMDEDEEEDDDDIELSDSEEEPEVNEARTNRKIEDLELSLKSLLVVNAMLEETVKKQAQQILQLKRQPNGSLSEQLDPLLAHAQQYTIKATDATDDDDEEDWKNDELFQRLHRVTNDMIEQGEKCVKFEHQILGRVLSDFPLEEEE
ncbi:unnamed protein product [Rhizopus stolonifer]